MSDPNGPISSKHTFFRRILLVQDGPEDARAANSRAKKEGFGVTLKSLCTLWIHFGPLSVQEGYFEVTLAHFQDILFFPIDFNDFI